MPLKTYSHLEKTDILLLHVELLHEFEKDGYENDNPFLDALL